MNVCIPFYGLLQTKRTEVSFKHAIIVKREHEQWQCHKRRFTEGLLNSRGFLALLVQLAPLKL